MHKLMFTVGTTLTYTVSSGALNSTPTIQVAY